MSLGGYNKTKKGCSVLRHIKLLPMLTIYWEATLQRLAVRGNTEALLHTSKKVNLDVKIEKIEYIKVCKFMHQHTIKIYQPTR